MKNPQNSQVNEDMQKRFRSIFILTALATDAL